MVTRPELSVLSSTLGFDDHLRPECLIDVRDINLKVNIDLGTVDIALLEAITCCLLLDFLAIVEQFQAHSVVILLFSTGSLECALEMHTVHPLELLGINEIERKFEAHNVRYV